MIRIIGMKRSRDAGFTLIELLVAMGLLATLGAFLVQLVRSSFQMYNQGDRRGDLYHNGLQILEVIEDDLLAVHSGPDGRFLLEPRNLSGGSKSGDGFFLRLVRTMPGGEQNHPHLRHAGTEAGGDAKWEGRDPGAGKRGTLLPPTGLMEVCYALIQEPTDPLGILTLYRGTFAPSGATGGFFDPAMADEMDAAWARKRLKPIASEILGIWMLCFGQESEDWDEEGVLDGDGAKGSSLLTWDSTRGILPKSQFPLTAGPASRRDTRDDIFPRKVRLLLQVARAASPEAMVRRTIDTGQDVLRVNSTGELPPEGEEDRYVKVGEEWLRLLDTSGSAVKVVRGRRHTSGVGGMHPVGTPVFAGQLFRLTLPMPSSRSFFIGRGGDR